MTKHRIQEEYVSVVLTHILELIFARGKNRTNKAAAIKS